MCGRDNRIERMDNMEDIALTTENDVATLRGKIHENVVREKNYRRIRHAFIFSEKLTRFSSFLPQFLMFSKLNFFYFIAMWNVFRLPSKLLPNNHVCIRTYIIHTHTYIHHTYMHI